MTSRSMNDMSLIDELTTVDLPEEDYVIRRRSREIKIVIRALSHAEALELEKLGKSDDFTNEMYEQRTLSQALVSPKMTKNEVKAWQNSSAAGEINGVVAAVMRLSGLTKDAAKEAFKSVRDELDAGE